MIAYIIISLIIVFSIGFITSTWYSSKTIEEYKNKLTQLQTENLILESKNTQLENKLNSYPTYTTYSDKV